MVAIMQMVLTVYWNLEAEYIGQDIEFEKYLILSISGVGKR